MNPSDQSPRLEFIKAVQNFVLQFAEKQMWKTGIEQKGGELRLSSNHNFREQYVNAVRVSLDTFNENARYFMKAHGDKLHIDGLAVDLLTDVAKLTENIAEGKHAAPISFYGQYAFLVYMDG